VPIHSAVSPRRQRRASAFARHTWLHRTVLANTISGTTVAKARLAVVVRVLLRVVLWPVASSAAGPVRRVPFCDGLAVSRRYCYPGAAVWQVLCPHPAAVRRCDGLHYRESEPGRLACAFVARG